MKRLGIVALFLFAGTFCISPSRATAQQYAQPGKFDLVAAILCNHSKGRGGVQSKWR
jgi:hypothetical protein